ncbi:Fic family protein [Helicobacter didelphidarum]|uniref:Fic family protein n=2 Tax=Helicobacter didelphidarum TaxID=2040648 RepID=A0A3D8IL57_9HELI|nr:Fic family protein [Helicobacter didelphidarum]
MIYEKDTFLANPSQIIKTNDILEAKNHFKAFDFILQSVYEKLSLEYLKKLHSIVKQNCSDIQIIGDFKQSPNFIGELKTTRPKEVQKELEKLLKSYDMKSSKTINELIDFHFHFERIHPFEDGNGRVGRLLAFKEALKNDIIPFIIDEEHRLFYYRGLREYETNKGYLTDTILACQDRLKEILEYYEGDNA